MAGLSPYEHLLLPPLSGNLKLVNQLKLRAAMDLSQIEDRLYDNLVPDAKQIKVAMLIGRAFKDLKLPADEMVNAALAKLAQRSDVETFGDFFRWRHSKVKRYCSEKS